MPRNAKSGIVDCPLECRIDVRVLRSDTRAPVESAIVELAQTSEKKTLGAAGVVSFEKLAPGQYTARVSDVKIEDEVPVGLPRSGETRVKAGGQAVIEVLVDVQDWEVTTIAVVDGEAPESSSGSAGPAQDWKIESVEVVDGEASESSSGSGAAKTEDWKIGEVAFGEVSADGSGRGAGEPPSTAPQKDAEWKIDTIKIVDDE